MEHDYYVGQLGACRGLVESLMVERNEKDYNIRQMETVLRLKESELMEAYRTIRQLRRQRLPLNMVGVMRE